MTAPILCKHCATPIGHEIGLDNDWFHLSECPPGPCYDGDQCAEPGPIAGHLVWRDQATSDGDEYWTDGAPDRSLHAFIFKPTDGGPVSWQVSDLSGDPEALRARLGSDDAVLAEGSCPTVQEARYEAEAFIRGFLEPSDENIAAAIDAARASLLALEADLSQ